jgi:hypothetical protein
MTKPYLLIAGENFYPSRDTGDWIGCFSTYEEAKAQVEPKKPKGYTINGWEWGCDWYKIVDLREWTER